MRTVLQYVLLGGGLIFGLVAAPLLALASVPGPAGGPVLVVAGPGADLNRIVTDAGGSLVGFAEAPLGVLSSSPDPDYSRKLLDNGAWFVLDGETVAFLCGDPDV